MPIRQCWSRPESLRRTPGKNGCDTLARPWNGCLGGSPHKLQKASRQVWMRETVRLAERAVAVAERLGHRRLGTGHVLLAMVDLAESEPDHDLASLFKEDGVDIAMVRQAVEAAVENEPDLLEIARVADVT